MCILLFNIISESIGRITHESFKSTVLSLVKLWTKWDIFELIFLVGLEATFLKENNTRENLDTKNDLIIKSKLESFEDELLDIYSKNGENIKYLASCHGISSKGEVSEIIRKLVYLKEFKLKRELIKV